MKDITQLLQESARGNAEASRRLFAVTYDHLKAIAHGISRQWADTQLDATGLVHECFIRMVGGPNVTNRAHFYALASRAMRQILCDQARRALALRRGGGLQATDELDDLPSQGPQAEELIAVERLFGRLAQGDLRAARAMECRVFGGFSVAETARALGVSERTVFLDLERAREWLEGQLSAQL